jgi:hypothetical protein
MDLISDAVRSTTVDGLLTVSDRVGSATNILTIALVAGVVVAVFGRGVRA